MEGRTSDCINSGLSHWTTSGISLKISFPGAKHDPHLLGFCICFLLCQRGSSPGGMCLSHLLPLRRVGIAPASCPAVLRTTQGTTITKALYHPGLHSVSVADCCLFCAVCSFLLHLGKSGGARCERCGRR